MKDVLKRAGIAWHGWHGFRRGLPSNLNRIGVDDSVIQRILRHSNDLLKGSVSILRFSIDGPEPEYSAIRQRPLDELLAVIKRVSESIPVGINTVITNRTLESLDRLAEIIGGLTVVDWLLLPETSDGKFVLDDDGWKQLRMWVASRESQFRLCISTQATPMLGLPVLLQEEPEDYAHIDACGRLRRCSYGSGGISLEDNDLKAALCQLWRGYPSHAALLQSAQPTQGVTKSPANMVRQEA